MFLEDRKAIFPATFDGTVGLFDGEIEMKLSPETKPVQLLPCAVALSVLSKLKEQLDKMNREDIIRPYPETTELVHNLVVVTKKNVNIRVCLDLKNPNKYVIRTLHYTA